MEDHCRIRTELHLHYILPVLILHNQYNRRNPGIVCYSAAVEKQTKSENQEKNERKKRKVEEPCTSTDRTKRKTGTTTAYQITPNTDPLTIPCSQSKRNNNNLDQCLAVPLLNFPFNLFKLVSLLPIPKSIFTAPLLSSRLLSTSS